MYSVWIAFGACRLSHKTAKNRKKNRINGIKLLRFIRFIRFFTVFLRFFAVLGLPGSGSQPLSHKTAKKP